MNERLMHIEIIEEQRSSTDAATIRMSREEERHDMFDFMLFRITCTTIETHQYQYE